MKEVSYGERLLENNPNHSNENEVYIDRDIIVLANPEIAQLPGWVIALVAAGGSGSSPIHSCWTIACDIFLRFPRPI